MRALNLLLALCMLAFMAMQFNDPDGLLWSVYYAVPAACAGLAAWRWSGLRTRQGAVALGLGVIGWALLMFAYWPPMARFWDPAVFMAEESAREGMGLMLAWLAMATAALGAARR